MILSDLMAVRGTPDPDYVGGVTNDDNVLAINITVDPATGYIDHNAPIDSYAVVQSYIIGVDAQMNATTQDKQYIRAGMSSTKVGTQRTFKATGDRYVGDDFQDFVFDIKRMYGVGEMVVTDYVWFNLLNGKGETGRCSLVVNSDGSGNAGETAAIDVDLRKIGDAPVEYNYTPSTLQSITVTSTAGTTSGQTTINTVPALPLGMTALYQTAVSVSLPAYDDVLTTGWQAFTSGQEYTANTGDEFAVAYVNSDNKTRYAGKTTVIAAS